MRKSINVFKGKEGIHVPEIIRVPDMLELVEGMVSLHEPALFSALFQTRFYRLTPSSHTFVHPWVRTSCVHAVVLRRWENSPNIRFLIV